MCGFTATACINFGGYIISLLIKHCEQRFIAVRIGSSRLAVPGVSISVGENTLTSLSSANAALRSSVSSSSGNRLP